MKNSITNDNDLHTPAHLLVRIRPAVTSTLIVRPKLARVTLALVLNLARVALTLVLDLARIAIALVLVVLLSAGNRRTRLARRPGREVGVEVMKTLPQKLLDLVMVLGRQQLTLVSALVLLLAGADVIVRDHVELVEDPARVEALGVVVAVELGVVLLDLGHALLLLVLLLVLLVLVILLLIAVLRVPADVATHRSAP
jgi:hypothetical protein